MNWISSQIDSLQVVFAEIGRAAQEHPRGMAAALFFVLSFQVAARIAGALGFVLCLMVWLFIFATGGERNE